MAAHALEVEHHAGQLAAVDFTAGGRLADSVVLAILATQVAPGEEDRPRAPPAAQRVLLSMVRAIGGDPRPQACATATQLLGAVDPAIAGTKIAGVFALAGGLHAPLQLPVMKQSEIGGLESAHIQMIADSNPGRRRVCPAPWFGQLWSKACILQG